MKSQQLRSFVPLLVLTASSALFGVGITTIYDTLPLGQHTIRNEYNSPGFFGGPFSFTYNITVVPEPASLLLAGAGGIALAITARRRSIRSSRA